MARQGKYIHIKLWVPLDKDLEAVSQEHATQINQAYHQRTATIWTAKVETSVGRIFRDPCKG